MRNSTNYIVKFVLIMTVVVAFILAGMQTVLKPIHDLNEAVYNKKSVLLAVQPVLDQSVEAMTAEDVQGIFDQDIEELVVDSEGNIIEGKKAEEINLEEQLKKPEGEQQYPLYVFESEGEKYYIVSVRGQGLWDAIWGNIALESDLSTIVGVSFDHAGETPGLGAEIKDNPAFPAQFKGKELYDESGNLVSVKVVKGVINDPEHQVDAISGATVTCNGVTNMMYKGIKNYEPYLNSLRKN
ncbi:NADH:ubiquinone reductase (Na(+)-transporting) subunit C [Membranihabitans maritimus]|uniref:NADH:ubiquinone reductase (Na(+)-transporting) subunit C n=1 Tax=Membranihabitans maritimus TaxID=2904244 RepID=UPI001F001AEA